MKIIPIVVIALTLAMSASAFAGGNPFAKVAIHVRPHDAKAACSVTISTCSDIVTTEPGFNIDAFPVFFDLAEFLGCEYGLCWPEWTYSAAFTSCGDLVIGTILLPGDGASHTWLTCQTGVCVPSYLWLYADYAGFIHPCPHPVSGVVNVLDCSEGVDTPVAWLGAGVYGMVGDDPCQPVGTSLGTWGGIKGVFE
jgi:hypothetical protein